MIRVPVRGWAASTLEPYAEEDWSTDAPEIEAVCRAFRRGDRKALAFYPSEADAVLDGLASLSNTDDERAEDKNEKRRDRRRRTAPAVGRGHLRRDCRGHALLGKIRRVPALPRQANPTAAVKVPPRLTGASRLSAPTVERSVVATR